MPEILRRLWAHGRGRAGLTAGGLAVLLAVAAPWIAPFDPDAVDAAARLLPPGGAHLLGTDEHGRDVLSRVLHGARVSLTVGLAAVAVAATVGTALGALAGWYGGLVDRAVSWITDLLLSLPRLVLLLAVVGLLRPTGPAALGVLVLVLGLTGWMGVARLVRAEIRTSREREFVAAARMLGLPDLRVLVLHLVPAALGPVVVQATLAVGATMVAEASLSFLGFGVPPPTASWGGMVADGRLRFERAPWIATAPGLALVGTALAFHMLGEALREVLDPRYRLPSR